MPLLEMPPDTKGENERNQAVLSLLPEATAWEMGCRSAFKNIFALTMKDPVTIWIRIQPVSSHSLGSGDEKKDLLGRKL